MKNMISREESKVIKKIIGSNYSRKIVDNLDLIGLKTKIGSSYTTSYIINIVNGQTSNEVVESAIFDMCKKCKLEQQKKEQTRREVLL